MRFSKTAALSIPLLLATSAIASQQCTCEPDQQYGQIVGQDVWNNWDPSAYQAPEAPKPVKKVPKVTPTEENLTSGAAQAVKQLTNGNILPPDMAAPVQAAIESVIKKHSRPVAVVDDPEHGTKTTITLTPTPTVVPTVVADANGMNTTIYVTQTVTALPPGATILPNETITALDSIQDAINDAIAAVNLSSTNLDAAAQAELQTCLTAVLENGGLPAGYSCISQTGSTSAGLKTTFNNILEQFLGILPSKIIDDIQDAVMPMLTNLLPNESTLLQNINSAISSVVSSLSGNSVTAIEMMQSCYSLAIKQNSNTSYLQCYMSDGGPFDTLETAMNSVIQQFVGYLPGTVLESVQNLTASTLKAGAYGDVSSIGTNLTQQMNAALASVTSALTGNSVTLMQELQACANELLQNGNATAAQNCIAGNPAETARTMVNSVAQQFSGYIPSAFFSDLVSIVSTMSTTGKYSKDQIITALDQAFNNANMGPAFVGCFSQVQTCLLNEIQATGDYSSVCPGPVAGCELIGSQNSTGLANTTAEAEAPAAQTIAVTNASAILVGGEDVTANATAPIVANTTSIPEAEIAAASAPISVDSASTESAASIAIDASSSSSEVVATPTSLASAPASTESSAPVESAAPAPAADSSADAVSDSPAPEASSATAAPTVDVVSTSNVNATEPVSTSTPETRFKLARRSAPFLRRTHGKARLAH